MNKCSPMQQFYKNQSIFITGGTGFFGKVLIEKLLRCCSDISSIFILVRSKKGKNIKERMRDLFEDAIFNRLKQQEPHFYKKIIPILGDTSLPNLDLSSQDTNLLIEEVSIVFHVAATVNFSDTLEQASAINIQSTESIIELCKEIRKLKSLIHVSTAYANCIVPYIEEKFYNYPIKSEDFLQLMKVSTAENVVKNLTKIRKLWPNIYTFTKAMAEDLIRTKSDNLPIGIFRPGIVISTAEDPIPGWIDNYYGPSGVTVGVAKGFIRIINCQRNYKANLVPVDFTINALIASAWDVAAQTDRRGEDTLIYNFVSNVESPVTWHTFQMHVSRSINKYPLSNTFWYPIFIMVNSRVLFYLSILFLHYLPAIFIDSLLIVSRRKIRLHKIYKKTHKFLNLLLYFTTHEWEYSNNNVKNMWDRLKLQDKQIFKFSMQNFDWPKYLDNYTLGIRTYLVKENPKNFKTNKIRNRIFYLLHQVLTQLIIFLGIWLLWNIFF